MARAPAPAPRGSADLGALALVGLLLTALLAVLALLLAAERGALAAAGLWPTLFLLVVSAQWAALALAGGALLLRMPRARARRGRGPALAALAGAHGLFALAALLLSLQGPGEPAAAALPPAWIAMAMAMGALALASRLAPSPLRFLAPVTSASLLAGAVAYWAWGWSHFAPSFHAGGFSLWKVGALHLAVDGQAFTAALAWLPWVHGAIALALALLALFAGRRAPAPMAPARVRPAARRADAPSAAPAAREAASQTHM